jgi:Trk K+ transport system NAD-binding subunit
VIVAIIRSGGHRILPRGDTVLQTGDEVLALVVSRSRLQRLAEILGGAHGDRLS